MWPLISYHYSSFRADDAGVVLQLADDGYALNVSQAELLYRPYIEAIRSQD
jgi:hypothetical protein